MRFDASGVTLDNKYFSGSEVPTAKCSNYKTVKWNGNYSSSGEDKVVMLDSSLLRVRDTDYTDAATFKAAVSNVMLVYELATPIEYPLTPAQLKTLKGANVLYTSLNGNVSPIYWTN